MEKKIITFTADEQSLRKTGGIPNYASNKVSYIEAQFELGENWQGFDAVRAIWYNKAQTISMVLADGKCIVPYEVLANKGQIMVNLVGSISENDVLTDRLTTYPVVALIVDADAKVDGSNTYPITPSQFEQFVEAVKADAESASESAESASASAESASASAKSAHDDKIEIEQKIAEVIQQIEDFEQVEVVVNTLPAGSQATSDFTDGVLTLGIPQGAKGDTGNGISSCVLNPDYTLTINFTDGTSYTTTSIRGAQGVKGDTGNGISSITKTGSETVDGRVVDTYTTTFTDGETTEFKVTNGKDGEVTMSQISALLPTDTASGDIASFSDGTDLVPAISVKATIEPIQSGSGTPSPDNVRPISGHTDVVTQRTGKNLISGVVANANIGGSGEIISASGYDMYFAPIKEGQTYVITTDNSQFVGGYFTSVPTFGSVSYTASRIVSYTKQFTAPIDGYVAFRANSGYGTPQLELGTTATDYEPYNGASYTTTLGRTVYGGTLEQVGGQLTDSYKSIDLGSLTWSLIGGVFRANLPELAHGSGSNNVKLDNFVSSNYSTDYWNSQADYTIRISGIGAQVGVKDSTYTDVASFTSAMNSVQLCYELATPQTYQLDPTEVDLLLGQNNVWSDCGSVEVTYKADIERWVNKKINALI